MHSRDAVSKRIGTYSPRAAEGFKTRLAKGYLKAIQYSKNSQPFLTGKKKPQQDNLLGF